MRRSLPIEMSSSHMTRKPPHDAANGSSRLSRVLKTMPPVRRGAVVDDAHVIPCVRTRLAQEVGELDALGPHRNLAVLPHNQHERSQRGHDDAAQPDARRTCRAVPARWSRCCDRSVPVMTRPNTSRNRYPRRLLWVCSVQTAEVGACSSIGVVHRDHIRLHPTYSKRFKSYSPPPELELWESDTLQIDLSDTGSARHETCSGEYSTSRPSSVSTQIRPHTSMPSSVALQ